MQAKDQLKNNYDFLEKTSPKMKALTENILFNDIWERTELSKHDRSLITASALIASGNDQQLEFHFRFGIENGISHEEFVEVTTHLAFYTGWPRSMAALNILEKVKNEGR